MSPPVRKIEGDRELPPQADVVIVGGGIVGCAAAYFLAKKRLRVVLLEKGNVAGEQSSRNWGWCSVQGKPLTELPLAQLSSSIWDGLAAETGEDVGFRRSGILKLTRDPAELAAWEGWTKQARDFQVPGRILSAKEAGQMVPTSSGWIAGWHSPTDGRAEPALAGPALAQAARRLGATILQDCAARGLETRAGAVSGVVTERGPIQTSAALCAAGAWTSLFCRRHSIAFPQSGVYATACRTTPAPAIIEGAVGCDGFSVRRREDGCYTVAVRLRGRVELNPQALLYANRFLPMLKKRWKNLSFSIAPSLYDGPGALPRWDLDTVTPFERNRVLDPAPDLTLVEKAMTRLRETFPALTGLRIAEAWGGLIDWTPDARPVISPVEKLPGLYIASGFSGVGFGLGPGAGRVVADMVSGDTPPIDLAPFALTRLTGSARSRPGAWI